MWYLIGAGAAVLVLLVVAGWAACRAAGGADRVVEAWKEERRRDIPRR